MADFTAPCAPGALPLLGHARQMLTSPTRFLTSLPAHGDLVRIRLGRRTVHVVCSHELASRVLLNSDRTFDKGGPFYDNVSEFFGDGLVTCPNAQHARLRRLTQPAFGRRRIAGYSDMVAREIKTVTRRWHDGQVLDVYRDMQELAMRITVSTMFAAWSRDLDAGGDGVESTLRDVDTFVRGAFLRMVAPGLARLPLPSNRRYEQARRRMDATIEETITAYRQSQADHNDLLSPMLVGDGSQDGLSDQEARDQIISMFIAGIGTTAATLAWILYFLSKDSELDAAVAAEAIQSCSSDVAAYDDVDRLPLLTNVITESFRILPTVWIYSRIAVADTVLGDHRLPPGAEILISPYVLHHRPGLFDDPERFDPHRWDGTGLTVANWDPGMATFGGGTRKCIGQHFALTNITRTLATILMHWKPTLATTRPVRMVGRSIIEPRGLRLQMTARSTQ